VEQPGPDPSAPSGGRVGAVGSWLAGLATSTCRLATVLAVAAGVTGATALLLGVLAWRDSLPAVVVVVLVGGAAVAAPWYVARRIRPMAEAVANPEQAAQQVRSYVSSLQAGPELEELIQRASTEKGRVRGLYRTSRFVGSLVSRVSPDPDEQPLLAAFHPVRLRALWLAVIVTWWLWFVSVLLATVAVFQLAIDAVA
jgi:hypothetical protein